MFRISCLHIISFFFCIYLKSNKSFCYASWLANMPSGPSIQSLHYKYLRSCSVVVITSALHAEGPRFEPGRDQACNFIIIQKQIKVKQFTFTVINGFSFCKIRLRKYYFQKFTCRSWMVFFRLLLSI